MGQQTDNDNAQVSRSWLDKVLAHFGKKKPEELTFDMTLNSADGTQITIEREEGEPQVGDKASPDGSWLMPDGETIVIEGGKITDIIPADQNKGNAGGAQAVNASGKGTTEPQAEEVAQLQASIATLEAERDQLQAQLTEAQGQVTDLQAQLTEAQAQAITEEQQRLLNALELAGGEAALAKISSQYEPATREPNTRQAGKQQGMSRQEGKQAILDRLKAVKGKK